MVFSGVELDAGLFDLGECPFYCTQIFLNGNFFSFKFLEDAFYFNAYIYLDFFLGEEGGRPLDSKHTK